MNYLAHILLSGPDPNVQIGGLLGDFIKGPLSGQYPARVEQGIALHRKLDAYMDQLPEINALLQLFPRPWRRYGGIVIDMSFDHLLASQWKQFHPQDLSAFCHYFYRHLASHRQWLPARAQHFCDRAPIIGWLESYAHAETIPTALGRIGERFRKPVPLAETWPVFIQHRNNFESTFADTMALLSRQAEIDLEKPRQLGH